jgi:hypothetical protein
MGMHHILSINDDALSLNKEKKTELAQATGDAVVKLCIDPQFGHLNGPELERVKSENILNCGNAARYADEVHYTETAIFVWCQGILRPLRELAPEELDEARKLINSTPKD